MTAYIIRRLLYMIPVVLGVLLITFVLFSVVGGDVSYLIAGKNADAETIAEIRHEYGFDKPLFIGCDPLEGDDAVWTAEKDTYALELNEALRQKRQEEADEITQRNNAPAKVVEMPQIKEDKIEKKWLKRLFWSRVKQGHLIQAGRMLNFDSQFINHFWNTIRFEFPRAMDRQKIGEKILQGIGPSLSLTVPMFITSIIITLSLSLAVAFLRGTAWDIGTVIACVALMSVPYLSFIIFGQYFFAYKMAIFPIYYNPTEPMVYSVILPILIGIVAGLGPGLRFYRTIMLDEIRSDFVRTAFAKGLTTRTVLFKHVLKNAMIPIVTNVVLSLPRLVLGSLLLERFFGIPGLGYLMIEAIASRDFFVLNAMTYMMTLLITVFTLLTDICYAWVDPRVKFE